MFCPINPDTQFQRYDISEECSTDQHAQGAQGMTELNLTCCKILRYKSIELLTIFVYRKQPRKSASFVTSRFTGKAEQQAAPMPTKAKVPPWHKASIPDCSKSCFSVLFSQAMDLAGFNYSLQSLGTLKKHVMLSLEPYICSVYTSICMQAGLKKQAITAATQPF